MSETNIIIGDPKTPVRLSYAKIWEAAQTPSGDMKFSTSILIPVTNKKDLTAVNNAIKAAIAVGVEKNKFTKAMVKALRLPLRDGTAEFDNEEKGAEYNGMMFLNASSKNAPGIVGPDGKKVFDQETVYSGCWALVDVNFFPYNAAGNRGIGVGLNNIMKIRDDERLDGKRDAEDAFAKYAIDETQVEDGGELE